ncbi:MAG: putative DUF51 family protein [Streblomastix strix]|uniref:Putative DUF51 family protein n=1 Tax=Streblomastix strix TaxID=222440 RepID=A0A5J4UDU0_9EUKA|nr:MAG: putative DUF51 family protein [Streblomastix strix]
MPVRAPTILEPQWYLNKEVRQGDMGITNQDTTADRLKLAYFSMEWRDQLELKQKVGKTYFMVSKAFWDVLEGIMHLLEIIKITADYINVMLKLASYLIFYAMAEVATKDMCGYCFDTLAKNFDGKLNLIPPSFENKDYPIFVTWHKAGRLRGCIGTFSPMPLHDGLKEYALVASLQDHRFRPVTAQEVPQLDVTVSLMHSFEPCSAWNDWEVRIIL